MVGPDRVAQFETESVLPETLVLETDVMYQVLYGDDGFVLVLSAVRGKSLPSSKVSLKSCIKLLRIWIVSLLVGSSTCRRLLMSSRAGSSDRERDAFLGGLSYAVS